MISERIARDLIILCVLAAIDFDPQAALETDEIDYVSADRMLPPKARIVDPTPAERTPQPTFEHHSRCCAVLALVRWPSARLSHVGAVGHPHPTCPATWLGCCMCG